MPRSEPCERTLHNPVVKSEDTMDLIIQIIMNGDTSRLAKFFFDTRANKSGPFLEHVNIAIRGFQLRTRRKKGYGWLRDSNNQPCDVGAKYCLVCSLPCMRQVNVGHLCRYINVRAGRAPKKRTIYIAYDRSSLLCIEIFLLLFGSKKNKTRSKFRNRNRIQTAAQGFEYSSCKQVIMQAWFAVTLSSAHDRTRSKVGTRAKQTCKLSESPQPPRNHLHGVGLLTESHKRRRNTNRSTTSARWTQESSQEGFVPNFFKNTSKILAGHSV